MLKQGVSVARAFVRSPATPPYNIRVIAHFRPVPLRQPRADRHRPVRLGAGYESELPLTISYRLPYSLLLRGV